MGVGPESLPQGGSFSRGLGLVRMRVLFLEIDTERSWAVASFGPAFIAAYLREHGHEVVFRRASVDVSVEELAREIAGLAPALIGVSLTTRQWQRARVLLGGLRERLDIPVVAGGLHPTFQPEVVLGHPGVDFVCLGEGEAPMLELVEVLATGRPPVGIDNIQVAGGPRPSLRPPFSPIDALPFVARDLLDEHPGVVHMATQRGCPFPCTYCGARMYDELYADMGGEYGRRRSHAGVLEELNGLRDAGQLAYVIFLDDTFTIHHPWVREFCQVYGERLGTPFSLHARVETVNERLLGLLAAAGCKQITYGVEAGSERVRREVMRRQVSNQRFRDVFRWTREAGIAVTANYMLGIPGETPAELQETVDLACELEVLDFGYFVFYPYPGTHLFKVCQRQGYLPEDYLDREANHRESILTLPGLTDQDIGLAYEQLTALRERRYRERLGPETDPAQVAAATGHVAELARRA